jgi:hypothetical protein
MKHGLNTDTDFLIRVSSVFHPWLCILEKKFAAKIVSALE